MARRARDGKESKGWQGEQGMARDKLTRDETDSPGRVVLTASLIFIFRNRTRVNKQQDTQRQQREKSVQICTKSVTVNHGSIFKYSV